MNRIAFYGGAFVVLIGLGVWLFRPNNQAGKNVVKGLGFEFTFDTPAFVVMAFGVLLIYMSTNFPEVMSKPPLPQVSIPSFSTGWINGDGKSTPYYCDPRKEAMDKEYPDYNITMIYLPEQHDENRDGFGIKHDKYMYGCSFAASAKK